MPIGSRAYDNRRLRTLAREVVGPDVLAIGYAQLPNPHLLRFHTVGVDLMKPLSPSGYAEEIQGDAMNLAACVGGRQFNTIVFGELIEHLEAPYQFLRGLHPFLAEGGRIVLSTPNPLGFPQVICEMLNIRRFYYTTEHYYSFPRRWMVRMLEATGFEVVAVRSVGLQLVYLAPPCPRFLSHQLVYVARQRGKRRGE
ncbi:MAG TPA: methyltransferase domain-containing protein [Planctomycetota bacterium]|nr:methyltransferase domain-containing protein [Planctomycetota bacterium]HRR78820.1 methyltransferase domain-containing protein [Planctomycetota bacterium]HRT92873.1 methyltransferase domain-containing protein [Planctomycetota bacterium]